MAFVVDASVACAWVFVDEATPALDDLLDRAIGEEVFVPTLWRSEVLNTLIQACRRKRITETEILEFWYNLEALNITESPYNPSPAQIIELCQKHSLTAYDAHYLALAMWLKIPLATLDSQLATAAKQEGITVLG